MMDLRRPRGFKGIAACIVGALITIWVVLLSAVVIWGKRDDARPASAIVVLGAAQYEGRPSPVLRARLDHAVLLWQRGLAPRLILTGGRGAGDTTSEAQAGKRYVMKRGVPEASIALETNGRTTSESLHAVSVMMRGDQNRSVILVSDPFHMLRLTILARRLGLRPWSSPTRTSPISANAAESLRYVAAESWKVPLAFLLERKPDEPN
jgi:uncharacterized SAM-binding protein YcdF (DUF218 family)